MTVGSIVLSTDQGLGYLAKDFFDNGIINKVFIHEHTTRTNHREWYPPESVLGSIDELIEACDTILCFETPFDWKVYEKAKAKGKKTVLIPMYECTADPLPCLPDLILSPSRLDLDYYAGSTLVTIPVSVSPILRSNARVFVHNAGNGGLGGRNGTAELIEAWQYVKSDATLLIRSQVPLEIKEKDPRVLVHVGNLPAEELYAYGDVFIFPERFNGLSLPLQEAYASGMLVMCGDRYPMNTWLPTDPMIPVDHYSKERIYREFDVAHYNPLDIARKVDLWYDKDIESYSRGGIEWGVKNSWKNLKPIYKKLLS